jgi:branched-chain amino acid transport system substrate-binding protein
MLVRAMQEANSSEPKVYAAKLEDMTVAVLNGGEGIMRKDDHQFFQPMYISALGPIGPDVPFDSENTGWGWKGSGYIPAKDTLVPTTCKMDRPS